MGGKGGGGGGGYYMQPADTSGYGTPEEADITLAKEKPLDLSGLQASINTRKAAAAATAPAPIPGPTPVADEQLAEKMASSVLDTPKYWVEQNKQTALKPRPVGKSQSMITTQT